ncbi:unnamed protein product [Staurois parvus]|uniref:Transposase Tc1-like domain-containing protein n=1 Tax=Staurois parvus TaxID=386267 RepID=A0ABN9BJG1_9NEOB|nr:unnamed protein product [Staurois parvus]
MTERGQHMLKRILSRSRKLSEDSIAKDHQTLCGLQISTTTVRRELHEMSFHVQAAASKPCITKYSPKHRMQWCKAHTPQDAKNGTCLTALCQV